MSIKQMLNMIRVGIRSKLFICILVIVTVYLFSLSHNPLIRFTSILAVMITSELMIMLWGSFFAKMLLEPLFKKANISWAEVAVFAKFRELASSQGIRLNKNKPFGVRKDFDNAYANPISGQIVIGDLLLQRLDDGPLTALIGHEMTHIKRKHYIKMLLWTMLTPIAVTFPLVIVRTTSVMYEVVFYATYFIVFLFVSWHNEYDADAGAAKIAGVQNVITLLRQIVPRLQWRGESETHPSIHSRVLKLKKREINHAIPHE
jgi:Zn-dependent protease with chaperone function